MTWEFKDDRPIYTQIAEQIKLRIVSGLYAAGARLPSVRDLAAEASVNPNTMQRALTDLEREGILYSERTSGRFVSEDGEMIRRTREGLAVEVVDAFLLRMGKLGYDCESACELVRGREGKQ
ncbi:MAG: GntR family transcriptional regulator [Clostridia bacterium]|nr:GntR family transcriptional regulator [Clostridia bacterium]